MSGGIKGAIQQLPADVSEAVVKPVIDEVGKVLEEGASTVVYGPPPLKVNPQVQAQKKADDEKKKAWALGVIEWNKKLSEEQSRVRMEEKQKNLQAEADKKQEERVRQFKIEEKKRAIPAALAARNTTEAKKGVGG